MAQITWPTIITRGGPTITQRIEGENMIVTFTQDQSVFTNGLIPLVTMPGHEDEEPASGINLILHFSRQRQMGSMEYPAAKYPLCMYGMHYTRNDFHGHVCMDCGAYTMRYDDDN